MPFPKKVKIVEVGPRDGLQNESKIVPIEIKIELINRLSKTGLKYIEAASFVASQWVPQMAQSLEVMQKISRKPSVKYSALVPNIKGFENAVAAKIDEIAIFTAASETFVKKNINCTIAESLQRFEKVIQAAKKAKIPVRGYISCSLGCPYEGEIKPQKVAEIAVKLRKLGCYEISLGDTIGIGTPRTAIKLINTVVKKIPVKQLAVHFHDTYGQALANIFAVLPLGIAVIDSAVAGLGGCPFAVGASGNVATEDVVYMLDGLNLETGINLKKIIEVGKFISDYLQQPTRSKVGLAMRESNSRSIKHPSIWLV